MQTTSTISWGRQERFKFSAFGPLDGWVAPAIPAVYAVTYRRDPRNHPKAHTVLFFGETEDLSVHAHSIKQKVVENWNDHGHTSDDLYILVHPMEGSSKPQRLRVQERLILEYQPQINKDNE